MVAASGAKLGGWHGFPQPFRPGSGYLNIHKFFKLDVKLYIIFARTPQLLPLICPEHPRQPCIMAHEVKLDKVWTNCRKIFDHGAFKLSADGHISRSKVWDGLAELHESMSSAYASAVQGCIICAAVTCIARDALWYHKTLLKERDMASGRLPIDDYADAYALENHQKDINNLEKHMVSKMRRRLFPQSRSLIRTDVESRSSKLRA